MVGVLVKNQYDVSPIRRYLCDCVYYGEVSHLVVVDAGDINVAVFVPVLDLGILA